MQSLDVNRPGMDDLQFVLMITALCTSGLTSLNVPDAIRARLFDRCWALVNEGPPPTEPTQRVLDLRMGTEVTLQALVEIIRGTLAEAGISVVQWDHPPSAPSLPSSPHAQPLVDRLERLYPPDASSPGSGGSAT